MIFPDKFTPFDKSIVSKVSYLMMDKGTQISLRQLRDLTSKHFDDATEFILAVDILFLLEVVEFDNETEILNYVD